MIRVVRTAAPSHRHHRYPSGIIDHAVWLYFRFARSFRDVEELKLERGVVVSHETIRRWCNKFGQAYANQLRRHRLSAGEYRGVVADRFAERLEATGSTVAA